METTHDYVEISKSIYLVEMPYIDESFPCECVKVESTLLLISVEPTDENSCGKNSSCINRSLSMECNPRTCPCQENCRNQQFQRKLYSNVEVFPTPGKGFGVRTNSSIEKGDFIFEYVGEVISHDQFVDRSNKYKEERMRHFYFMTLQNDLVIDATRKGSISRFMNHSCNPNCETQKWIVNGKTELTFNYRCERFGDTVQRCLCGEPNCVGFIGQQKESTDEYAKTQNIYEGFVANNRTDVSHCITALIQDESPQTCINALEAILTSNAPDIFRDFLILRGLSVLASLLDKHRDQIIVSKV